MESLGPFLFIYPKIKLWKVFFLSDSVRFFVLPLPSNWPFFFVGLTFVFFVLVTFSLLAVFHVFPRVGPGPLAQSISFIVVLHLINIFFYLFHHVPINKYQKQRTKKGL